MIDIRHPVHIQLIGEDGNGFLIASRARIALKKAGVSEEEREEFGDDALSGDYGHLSPRLRKDGIGRRRHQVAFVIDAVVSCSGIRHGDRKRSTRSLRGCRDP